MARSATTAGGRIADGLLMGAPPAAATLPTLRRPSTFPQGASCLARLPRRSQPAGKADRKSSSPSTGPG
eukprot:586440-Alexandrium_andersonii.AAC.1